MADVWVVNASPLIVLARIGQLDLAAQLAAKVIVPEAVAREILAGPNDAAKRALADGWGERATATGIPDTVTEWSLGAGESEVIALALERRPAIAVLDDAEARACARTLSVPLIGTIAVLVMAKRKGLIAGAAPLIRLLKNDGFRLADDIAKQALLSVGEDWPPKG